MPLIFSSPPISLGTAHCFAGLFSLSYVGSLYISKNARLSFTKGKVPHLKKGEQREKENHERWRNDPDVIRARMVAVSLSTVSSCGIVLGLVWRLIGGGSETFLIAVESTLARLGFTTTLSYSAPSPYQILLPCLVTPVLFLGPLYADYLAQVLPFQKRWSWRESLMPMVATWQGWRNYIVGPGTEEVVFRACMLAVYHLAGVSRRKMIFLTPLTFGLAHVHHAWDIFNRYGRTKWAAQRALTATVFQLAYTSLFGFHTAFLFLRTGSLIPPLAAHVFCNVMGFPQLSAHLACFPRRRTAIKLAYVLGVVGYVYTLGRWTRADSLYWAEGDEWPRF